MEKGRNKRYMEKGEVKVDGKKWLAKERKGETRGEGYGEGKE